MHTAFWRSEMLIVPMLVMTMAVSPSFVRAQEATPAPAAVGELVRVAVPQLPGPPDPGVEVWLVRFVLDPGVVFPPSPDLGVGLQYVEQGDVTFVVEGSVEVVHAGGVRESIVGTAGTPVELPLGPGDTLVSGSGTRTGFRVTGAAPASVLGFLVFSPIEEATAMQAEAEVTPVDQMSGVQPMLLSAGRGSLPEGPGTLVIERIVVAAGTRADVDRTTGVEVGNVEQGTIRLGLTTGEAFVWPDAASPAPNTGSTGPETIATGSERDLESGDGYALPTGSTGFWQTQGSEPVTILRGVVQPDSPA